ncbi:MAG TPA: hypothetical protein VMF61_06055 [Candidatus Acidoferrales bacterium]|nr:hypothetical protein [Candidatus Acidoferrales bacterium]
MHGFLLGAIVVRALALQPHATVDPFGARSLMAVASDGSVAATTTVDGFSRRIVVWNAAGRRRVLGTGAVAGFDRDGSLLINAPSPMRVGGGSAQPIDLRSCENFPQSSVGPLVDGVLTDGALIVTMQSPSIVDLDDTSGQNAPVVLHVRSDLCTNLGNGVALATAGSYAAGYTAYIAGVPAPSNVASNRERFTAVRWNERARQPLGPGIATAVNSAGDAAGSDLPPGGMAYENRPHARAWIGGTGATPIAGDARLSVAYAIDAHDRVLGMLEDAAKRHYAFVWQNGRLQRLDDVVHDPAWRFECAYAFAPDGSVVGVGTYRGHPTAFRLWGL